MTNSLVVGVDAGATSTRVAVHALDGTRVGYARAGAGNPTAHGLAKAVGAIAEALGQALGSHDGSRVVASLAGVAGTVEALKPELAKVWGEHGITVGPRVTGDVPIAYVAGSPAPEGALLLSGTGAVAARISGFQLAAIADGLGWLLGDEGSGFWIGREAARAAVAALDRRTAEDPTGGAPEGAAGGAATGMLVELVVEHFLGAERGPTPRKDADRVVRLAQADHMRLAALSALVSRAAAEGDPLALDIVRRAAGHLVATVRRVHVSGPVVLAGSVLTSEGPVREAVRELLGDVTVTTAQDGAGAAAWLAARALLDPREAEELHPRFVGP
ncbi:BadF/BadG/BcrA/BcrD ATPase family protein [Nonomuraea sp. NPDC005983]|uniref:N-acetylglucosamine kinase n=1 Tax=Nonomuraea sp. NPDC005983 TaxID=3155595 RepID=UPI0033B85A72